MQGLRRGDQGGSVEDRGPLARRCGRLCSLWCGIHRPPCASTPPVLHHHPSAVPLVVAWEGGERGEGLCVEVSASRSPGHGCRAGLAVGSEGCTRRGRASAWMRFSLPAAPFLSRPDPLLICLSQLPAQLQHNSRRSDGRTVAHARLAPLGWGGCCGQLSCSPYPPLRGWGDAPSGRHPLARRCLLAFAFLHSRCRAVSSWTPLHSSFSVLRSRAATRLRVPLPPSSRHHVDMNCAAFHTGHNGAPQVSQLDAYATLFSFRADPRYATAPYKRARARASTDRGPSPGRAA